MIRNRTTWKRWAAIAVVLMSIVSLLSFSRPANAVGLGFGGLTITEILADIPRKTDSIVTKITDKLKAAFKIGNDVAFKSSIQIFNARLLQEVQIQLATGEPGQKPQFITNPKTFFKTVANRAAGDYIDDLSRGLTGEIGVGTSTSGARGKFLITRLLRQQTNSVVGGVSKQCKADCDNSFSVSEIVSDPGGIANDTEKEFNENKGDVTRNVHEARILELSFDIVGAGGIQSIVDSKKTDPVTCPDIVPLPGAGDILWAIAIGSSDVILTPEECLNALNQLILVEQSIAQTDTNQCMQNCQTKGSAASLAVNSLTATDIFSSVKNANPTQVPAQLANALSNDTSDIGALLTAAGAMTATVQQVVQGEQTNLDPNILPKTTAVSDQVKSPSTTASTLLGVPFVGENGQFTYTGSSVADVLKGISSFINSPVGKALAMYFKSKCGLNPELCKGPSNARSAIGQLVFGSGGPTGVAGAQLLYATTGKVDIRSGNPGQNEISITDQLAANGLIDSGFRQAIEETLTVQEALDKGFLDKQRTFGFDKNGQEPTNGYPFRALQYLRKFRVTPVGWELAAKYSQQFDHRDLSLGYLVSRYNMCSQDESKSLCSVGGASCSSSADVAACTAAGGTCTSQVVSRKNAVCTSGGRADQSCQQDGDCGTDDNGATITCGASPYCGLVDPNWVLKAPQTFCRRQGAGEEIIAKEFVCDENNVDATTGQPIAAGESCGQGTSCNDIAGPNCVQNSTTNPKPDIGRWVIERNSDTCADTQSCISENEDGSCLAYGYCVQERQQFKFDGTQCAVENGTCASFTNPVGQQVSFLQNTLDSRNCNADNAGCTQYCAAPDYDPTTTRCVTPAGATPARINFTAKVQQCDVSQVGCTQYLQTSGNANLLADGGFEYFSQPIDDPDASDYPAWTKSVSLGTYAVTADDLAVPVANRAAVRLDGASSDTFSQIVNTGYDLYERSFTFSIRAKSDSACSATLNLEVNNGQAGRPRIPADPVNDTNMTLTSDWATYAVTMSIPSIDTFNPPLGTYQLKAAVRLGGCAGRQFFIDSAQLEPAPGPTQFHDYGTNNALYLNNSKVVCSAADVGCQGYTPAAGGSEIFGQVRDSNRCAADKVGCDNFELEPILGVPPRNGGTVQIIAPKGQICSAADVGCEEYTNLDEVARGGEGREYFKSVKQCLKPSQVQPREPGLPGDPSSPAESATYYTWVGDAQLGFVLRSYELVKSDVASAPNQFPPCTNLTIEPVGVTPRCQDANPNPLILPDRVCAPETLATNPDCAEYYDSALVTYYRLRSKTVTITEDCHPYRNTIDQAVPGRENLIYQLSTQENLTCSAAVAGCRAYTGNASGTTRQIFNDTFEFNGTANWEGGQATNESVNVGGHSMLVKLVGGSTSAVTKDVVLKNQLFAGRTYLVSFIASAVSAVRPTISVKLGSLANGSFLSSDTFPGSVQAQWNSNSVPPAPEWHSYTVGPLLLSSTLSDAQLAFVVSGGDANVDNVVLTEVNDHVYLVSSSVPRCEATDVGCSAYRDRQGVTNYLTEFSRLCSEQVVGCEALIDTKNSTSPTEQIVKTVRTPADEVVTLVNNPAAYCSAAAKGCNVFGLPSYIADDKLAGYQSVYLINDPDRHSADLCLNTELSCQAYTTSTGTAAYFKDPKQSVCDYRTGGDGAGQWYITGTSFPCPIVTPPLVGRPIGASCTTACHSGSRNGKACVSDADCPAATAGNGCLGQANENGNVKRGNVGAVVPGQCESDIDCLYSGNSCLYLAGSCPAVENGCTEYRDPTDPASCRAECPLSLSQGGSPDLVDGACKRTRCADDSDRAGQNCGSDSDCQDVTGPHACVGGDGQPAVGIAGCRSYFYLRQSIEANAGSCNGTVNTTIGCRPFNDTSKPNLNFRGQ